MIRVKQRGNFKNTERFLKKAKAFDVYDILRRYGDIGVAALSAATPVNTGKTAGSWFYEIEERQNGPAIVFCNSNTNRHLNIAILINYGHGTKDGAWVEGRDFIDPAITPICDQLADAIWKEVKNA